MNAPLNTPLKTARRAGILYLIIAIVGVFAIAYVPSRIIITGDAPATFANLQAHAGLFRAGILADIVVIVLEIELTAALYYLMRPVNPIGSMIAAMARYGMVLVMLVNVLLNITAFAMASGAMRGAPETVMTLFDIHATGIQLWGVLFGYHLFALGALICRSGYLPRWLGGALVVGAFGYVIEGLSHITGFELPALSVLAIGLLTLVTIAEIGFALWLLIKGLDEAKWRLAAG